jgi:hypothetical protein
MSYATFSFRVEILCCLVDDVWLNRHWWRRTLSGLAPFLLPPISSVWQLRRVPSAQGFYLRQFLLFVIGQLGRKALARPASFFAHRVPIAFAARQSSGLIMRLVTRVL